MEKENINKNSLQEKNSNENFQTIQQESGKLQTISAVQPSSEQQSPSSEEQPPISQDSSLIREDNVINDQTNEKVEQNKTPPMLYPQSEVFNLDTKIESQNKETSQAQICSFETLNQEYLTVNKEEQEKLEKQKQEAQQQRSYWDREIKPDLDKFFSFLKTFSVIFNTQLLPIDDAPKRSLKHWLISILLWLSVGGGVIYYLLITKHTEIHPVWFLIVGLDHQAIVMFWMFCCFLISIRDLKIPLKSFYFTKNAWWNEKNPHKSNVIFLVVIALLTIATLAAEGWGSFANEFFLFGVMTIIYLLLKRHWSVLLVWFAIIAISYNKLNYIDWTQHADTDQTVTLQRIPYIHYRSVLLKRNQDNIKPQGDKRLFSSNSYEPEVEFIDEKVFEMSTYNIGLANALSYTVLINYDLHPNVLNMIQRCRKEMMEKDGKLDNCTVRPSFIYTPAFKAVKMKENESIDHTQTVYSYNTARAYIDSVLKEKVFEFMEKANTDPELRFPLPFNPIWFQNHYSYALWKSIANDRYLSQVIDVEGKKPLNVSFSNTALLPIGLGM